MTTASLRISVEPFDGPVASPSVTALLADLGDELSMRFARDLAAVR